MNRNYSKDNYSKDNHNRYYLIVEIKLFCRSKYIYYYIIILYFFINFFILYYYRYVQVSVI